MKIIAFYSYNCYAGKNTAADMMAENLEYMKNKVGFTAFANVMKIVAADALGVPGTDEYKIEHIDKLKHKGGLVTYQFPEDGQTVYSTGQTGRDFIIGLAGGSDQTYGMRRWQQDIWIKLCLDNAPECDVLLITDMRFQPEADEVRARGGTIVELTGRGEHKNEDVIEGDYVVDNSHDLAHLRAAMTYIANQIQAGELAPSRRN